MGAVKPSDPRTEILKNPGYGLVPNGSKILILPDNSLLNLFHFVSKIYRGPRAESP